MSSRPPWLCRLLTENRHIASNRPRTPVLGIACVIACLHQLSYDIVDCGKDVSALMRGQGPTRTLMSHPTGSSWRICLLLFLLALGLRLGYAALVWSGPLGNADSPAYEDLAVKIISSKTYQTNESGGPGGFPPDLQRPPGYPAYLAAVNYLGGSSLSNS